MIAQMNMGISIVSAGVLSPFHYAFVQRGTLELLMLSVGAGVLGTWVVLRGLAFYSHGVAAAAFPGLVLAAGVGFSPQLGAFASALGFAFGVERLARDRRHGHDSLTALVLVGALALGVILASDVFHSRANVETLLFGSVLAVGNRDLALAGLAGALVLIASLALGGRWLAVGFDRGSARAIGLRSTAPDAVLLVAIALSVTSALAVVGVMLAGALYVVPAATTRLWVRSLRRWQLASVALAGVEGVAGLWLSVEANVPPGAAIAVLAGTVFALAAAAAVAGPKAALVPAAAGAVVLLTGCGGGGGGGKPGVVATTTQIGDWAREVGGNAVAVHQLLQPNTDPHEYEPRPKDVLATARAAVVLENGDGLDGWMDKVVSRAGGDPEVVDLGKHVPVRRNGDPHWWHDPRNVEAAVRAIAAALVRVEPARRPVFERNAARYLERLHTLDARIAACMARVPARERTLVTSHDAFAYFAARYGIRIVGAVIPSQTSLAQPSAGDVARLIELVRSEHVRALFPETSINSALADTIAHATGATVKYRLYGDSLGPAGSSGATYLSMELTNADQIVRGFTGGREGCG
jgi:ABC-type Zn uptake system ZnuABC Zn-binding protein ZnuA